MANVIKFDMKNTPTSLDEMFVRVTDTDRNELFSGTQSITDSAIELNLGALGSIGQSVLVYGDNFNGSNASTYKAFSGYSLIEGDGVITNKSYTYNLNGTDQHFQLENRIVDVDNLAGLRFKFFTDSTSNGGLIGQAGTSAPSREFQVFYNVRRFSFLFGGSELLVNDVPWGWVDLHFPTNSTMILKVNGKVWYDGSITIGAAREPEQPFRIGARDGGFNKAGIINNFEVYQDETLIHSITFKDKEQGATQLDTIGSNNATIINYNEDDWIEHYDSPITKVIFVGASILGRTYDDQDGSLELGQVQFDLQNISVEIYDEATGGDDSSDTLGKVSGWVSEYSDSPQSTLVVLHTGGNDATLYGPYPGGATDLSNNMRSIVEQFQAAGFKVAMSPISYRIPPGSNPPEPYNENVVQPLIDELADLTYNLYELSFDNQGVWFEPDNVHPNEIGKELNREYIPTTLAPQMIEMPIDFQ